MWHISARTPRSDGHASGREAVLAPPSGSILTVSRTPPISTRPVRCHERGATFSASLRLAGRCAAAVAVLVLALSLMPASIATAGVLESALQENKHQRGQISSEMKVIDTYQRDLNHTIEGLNSRIATVNAPILLLDSEIADLQARIDHRRARISQLQAEFKRQKHEIRRLNAELDIAHERLAHRLVELYKRGDPSYSAWLLGARSMRDLVNRQEMVGQVATLDSDIVGSITETERQVRIKRARNHGLRRQIRQDIASISADEQRAASARAELVGRRTQLENLKIERARHLNRLESREQHLDEQFDRLEDDSAALEDAIKNGYTNLGGRVPGGLSPSGLIWPVNGPVVSPFGQRWGRLHAGIDIAVGAGTPIHAAATGIVTYSGWMSGYGNLVIVQHAGALSTAYAHQSRIGAANGQFVSQGQVVGYVGCTGHCFGDHLHFETRVNGGAVDPMYYL